MKNQGITDEEERLIHSKLFNAMSDERTYHEIQVSEITSCVITLENGKRMIIYPKKASILVKTAVDAIRSSEDTKFLGPFLNKRIIFSFEAAAAFTDGNRIAMSPIFTHLLIKTGQKEYKQAIADDPSIELDSDKLRKTLLAKFTKYILYIIVHECYHIFYKHHIRAYKKFGGFGNGQLQQTANVAMDMEINRDIESYIHRFDGCTKTLNGVWWENYNGGQFRKNTWEEIYDWLIANDPLNPTADKPEPPKNPKASKYSDAFKKGWAKALAEISARNINPLDM